MTDPVQELVDTLAALREDVTRIERVNAGLVTAVQAAQKATERIGSAVGAEAGRAAADRITPIVSGISHSVGELRAATKDAIVAAATARDAGEAVGRGIPRPLAATALLGLLAGLGGAFLLGWHYGPGDWRTCPADKLVVDQKTGGAWCRLN